MVMTVATPLRDLTPGVSHRGSLSFKKGLLGKWTLADCTLTHNEFHVASTEGDSVAFCPHDSWISARWSENTGLFVVNATGKSSCKLFLFETKSEGDLRMWLDAFVGCGWSDPTLQCGTRNLQESNDVGESEQSTPLDAVEGQKSECNSSRTSSQCEEHSEGNDTALELASEEAKDEFPGVAMRHVHSASEPLTVDITHDTIESGYCSKESLSPDVDKGFFKAIDINTAEDINQHQNTQERLTNTKLEEEHGSSGASARDDLLHRGESQSADSLLPVDDCDTPIAHELCPDPGSPEDAPVDYPRSEKTLRSGSLFSQLKYRLASSKRTKGRKSGRKGTFGGHMLCNQKGTWKTMWFYLQDGVLYAFRDIGLKPALMKINLSMCKMTCYAGKDWKRLNIFKISGDGQDVTFAAWSAADYKGWMTACQDYISFREDKEGDLASSKLSASVDGGQNDDELFMDGVVPYAEAQLFLEQDHRREARGAESRTSSDTTDAGVLPPTARSSVDSGNDGDESGLESSGATWDLQMASKRMQQLANRVPLSTKSLEDDDQSIPRPSRGDQSSRVSTAHTKSETDLLQATQDDTPAILSGGGSSEMLSPRSYSVPNKNHLIRPTLAQQRHSLFEEMLKSQALIEAKTSSPKCYNRSHSFMGPRPVVHQHRPQATGSTMHDRYSSLDSNDSTQSWDVVIYPQDNDRRKGTETKASAYSEDSEDGGHTPPSPNAGSPNLERTTRSDVLLRKHRNSLRLERDLISKRLFSIHDKIKARKNATRMSLPENEASDTALSVLQGRLLRIDHQLDSLDSRLSGSETLPLPYKSKEKRQRFTRRHTTAHLFSKLRQPLKSDTKKRSSKKIQDADEITSKLNAAALEAAVQETQSLRQRSSSDMSGASSQRVLQSDKPRPPSDDRLERQSVSSIDSTLQDITPTEELDRLSFTTQDTIDSNPRSKSSNASLVVQPWREPTESLNDALQKIEDFENFSALVSAQLDATKYVYCSDV